LEVALVKDTVTINQCLVARARTHRHHQVYHYGGGLPLARRYARIQVAVGGLEQGLSYVGSGPARSLQPCSMLFAHPWLFLPLADSRPERPLDSVR
jgi:hypothetical protein